MTTVYLIRHSKILKVDNSNNKDDIQIQNEKTCLSIEGEEFAKEVFENPEYKEMNAIYSSNYVRAIQTAKYIASNNNLEIQVMSNLGEREFGVSSWDEVPEGFEKRQLLEEDYKIGKGESQREVRERMISAIADIIQKNKNQRIAIVSHATAIAFLLKKWCDITIVDDKLRISFQGKTILDGFINHCETFKLVFDENNHLLEIHNIK